MAEVQPNQDPDPAKPESFDADTFSGIQIVRRASKPGAGSRIRPPPAQVTVLPPPADDSGNSAEGGSSRLGRQSRVRPALKMPEPGRKSHFPMPPGMEPSSQLFPQPPAGMEPSGVDDMAGTATIRLSAPMRSSSLTGDGRRSGSGMNSVAGFTRKPESGAEAGANAPPVMPLPPPMASGAGMPMPAGFPFPVAPATAPHHPPPIPGFAPSSGTGMPMPLMPAGSETPAAPAESRSGTAAPAATEDHHAVVLGLRRKSEPVPAEKSAAEDANKDAEDRHAWISPDHIYHLQIMLICLMFVAAEIITKGLPLLRAAKNGLGYLPLAGSAFLLLGFLGLICVDKAWSRVLTGIYFFFCIVSSGVMTLVLPIFAALVARWGRPDYMDVLQFLPAVSLVAAAFSLYLSSILLLFGSAGPVRWSLAGAAMVAAMILPWTAIEKCLPREEMFSFGAASNIDDLESSDPRRNDLIHLPGRSATGPGHDIMPLGGQAVSVTSSTNYEINLPDGWRFDPLPPNPDPELLAVLSSLDGLIQVEVRVLSIPNPEATLGFVTNSQIEEIRPRFPGVTSMDIKGMPDRKKIYAVSGHDRVLQLVVNGGKGWFLLSCRTSADLLKSRQEDVDLVFRSFDVR